MFAGTLTEIITFEKPVTTKSESGFETTQWEKVVTAHACQKYNSKNLTVENDQMTYNYSIDIEMRYTDKVAEYMRFIWNGRKYSIRDIDRQKRYGKMTITAEIIDE